MVTKPLFGLANQRLQPLGHLSVAWNAAVGEKIRGVPAPHFSQEYARLASSFVTEFSSCQAGAKVRTVIQPLMRSASFQLELLRPLGLLGSRVKLLALAPDYLFFV